jgi:hypothetical protein
MARCLIIGCLAMLNDCIIFVERETVVDPRSSKLKQDWSRPVYITVYIGLVMLKFMNSMFVLIVKKICFEQKLIIYIKLS